MGAQPGRRHFESGLSGRPLRQDTNATSTAIFQKKKSCRFKSACFAHLAHLKNKSIVRFCGVCALVLSATELMEYSSDYVVHNHL